MMEDDGENYEIPNPVSKADLADIMTATGGRVRILELRGDIALIRNVRYVLDPTGRRQRAPAVGELKGKKAAQRPWDIETEDRWVVVE